MKKIKVGVLILLSIIFLTEIGLRVFANKKLRRVIRPQYVMDADLGYKYVPKSEGYFITAAFKNKYKINSIGFNWDEFIIEKPLEVFRIILIGFSDDNGIPTNGQNGYARLLQKRFKLNKDKIEIMNFSIDGGGRSFKHLELAKRSAVKYSPDLILFNFNNPILHKKSFRITYNGFLILVNHYNESLKKTKKYIDERLVPPSIISITYDMSYIFRYLCKFYVERPSHPVTKFIEKYFLKERIFIKTFLTNTITNLENTGPPDKIRYSAKESINIYKAAKDSLAIVNTKFVLFNAYKNKNSEKQKVYFKSYKLDYIDLMVERLPECSFGKVNGHSTQKGHQAIAKSFYKKLFNEGIIPQEYFSDKTKTEMSTIHNSVNE